MFSHPEFDNHEHVAFHQDTESGLQAIIAVHNSNLGPSLGGCRMWPYTSAAQALTDVLRLSKGMTYKAAMAGLPQGGGKSVIIGDPRTEKTPEMMRAMGRFVDNLQGLYVCAEDSGISVDDMHTMSEETRFVAGLNAKYHYNGGTADGNPAPATAYGVYTGIKAAVKHKFNSDLDGVRIAIQGLGHVGWRLAEHLHRDGARLVVSDIFEDNIAKAIDTFDAKFVQPNDIVSQPVDVFAPCAMGAVINEQSIHTIQAKIIAGAANNQLSEDKLGEQLVAKDVLYAPDYVINAGGIIDIYHQQIDSSAIDMKTHIERVGDTLLSIFEQAEDSRTSTREVADRQAKNKFN